jgi:hypothetical protein
MKKELVLKSVTEKVTYNDEILIEWEGDVNDGDYVNTTTFHTLDELDVIMPVLIKIDEKVGHNWYDRDYLTEEEEEILDNMEVYLNGDHDRAHTADFSLYFLSKDDSIQYPLDFSLLKSEFNKLVLSGDTLKNKVNSSPLPKPGEYLK